jgi:hypothetical protein
MTTVDVFGSDPLLHHTSAGVFSDPQTRGGAAGRVKITGIAHAVLCDWMRGIITFTQNRPICELSSRRPLTLLTTGECRFGRILYLDDIEFDLKTPTILHDWKQPCFMRGSEKLQIEGGVYGSRV